MKKLNLGCGKDILADYINTDLRKGKGIDVCFDLNINRYPFEDNEFDVVRAFSVIEHLNHPLKAMKEIIRITKPGGKIKILVPYIFCPANAGQAQHLHAFSYEPFSVFENKKTTDLEGENLIRQVKMINCPTPIGKLIPNIKIKKNRTLREAVALFIGSIISDLEIEYVVE